MSISAILLGLHSPFAVGCGIGLLLALANFYVSVTLSSKALTSSLMKSEVIILFGFLLRLTALGAVFYGLSKVAAIHTLAVLITFLIGFTLLLLWEIRLFTKIRFQT